MDNLERQWNEKFTSLSQAEEEYSRMSKSQPSALMTDSIASMRSLPTFRVCGMIRVPARDRKRMLRLLIEDVTSAKNQNIQIHIRWKAGATTSMERLAAATECSRSRSHSCGGHRRILFSPRHRTNGCSNCTDSQRALLSYWPEAPSPYTT